jgi:hypothetical protein
MLCLHTSGIVIDRMEISNTKRLIVTVTENMNMNFLVASHSTLGNQLRNLVFRVI